MKIVEFSLQRYRSIQKAEKIRLGDLTILIGPNNEGKSNILRGLVTGMRLLASTPGAPRRQRQPASATYYRPPREDFYVWGRDFPIALQEAKPDGTTIFDFVFELSDEEVAEFQSEVKSKLNGTLPIRLTAGPNSLAFEVRKRGPGGKALTEKRTAIADFVGTRLNPQDIPAIRTAQASMRIVNEMVQSELRRLETSTDYAEAVAKVTELQRPILDEIGRNLRSMLNTFLPDVASVDVELFDRYRSMNECEIIVDDGTATDLRYKGDGVQSLAAISLIHHVAAQSPATREIVLALEEPEAHLHPNAIHQVKRVLAEIASKQQVILTTHSPLLVNRANISSNVIVNRKKAYPAENIRQIREVLGVRVADNLSAAEYVLLVEGREDRVALSALLPDRSSALAHAISEGRLAIDDMHGTGNLRYRLALMADSLCSSHVLLDHDPAGTTAAKSASDEGMLETSDLTFTTSVGMKHAEFEDWIDPALYLDAVRRKFGVHLNTAEFRQRKAKWSDRVKREFIRAGKLWDDETEVAVKSFVTNLVASNTESALKTEWATSFDALIAELERKLETP